MVLHQAPHVQVQPQLRWADNDDDDDDDDNDDNDDYDDADDDCSDDGDVLWWMVDG